MRRFAVIVLLLTAFSGCRAATPPTARRPNILLITIDTWRADRLTAALTPNLSTLAAAGTTFSNARSAVPLTLPSHTTILTGLLPPAHGVRENGNVLGESHATIARSLKEHGYQTAAFVGAFVLDRRFGLARDFDRYDDKIPRDPDATEKLEAERPAAAVVTAARDWLNSLPSAPDIQHPAPFFVWIHFYDPHAPYDGGYDAEVGRVDAAVGEFFDELRRRGEFANTVIVVAGDHGEGLGEHGERTHGMLLYDSTLRVPLFIAGPGVAPQRRDDAVSLVDIAPTILKIAGIKPAQETTGTDLLGRGEPHNEDVYAESEYPRVAGWSPLQALTDGRYKAIRAGSAIELYDLANDPKESQNLAGTQSSTATAMSSRIQVIYARGSSSTATPVSAEAQERLRALGYVASSAQPSDASNRPNPAATIAEWNLFEEALSALGRSADRARMALKPLAAKYPDAQVFQTTYATALKDSGKPAEALAIYRAAAKRWPTDATLLHDLAVAAREAGQLDEAVKADRAALALQPASPTAHNGLGLLAIDQGRPHDAVHEFAAATQIDPNNASYWANLGNAKRAIGDPAGAEQAYRKALDVDANSPDAANGLGVLLVEAKRPSEAVDLFSRAVRERPDFVEAELNYAIALQQSGSRQRAIDAYRSILSKQGNHPREKQAARELLAALGATR